MKVMHKVDTALLIDHKVTLCLTPIEKWQVDWEYEIWKITPV